MIRFFLDPSDIISIRSDDSKVLEVLYLKDMVYTKYEIKLERASVDLNDLTFFALVRPICIEPYC